MSGVSGIGAKHRKETYPREVHVINDVEPFDILLLYDQDLGYFPSQRQPKNRPFVVIAKWGQELELAPLSRLKPKDAAPNLVHINHGIKSYPKLAYRQRFSWNELIDLNATRFGKRSLRLVDRWPHPTISLFKQVLMEVGP